MNTFYHARLKLTLWYLLIIMSISLAFSVLIFRAWTVEIERFERAQRFFIERRLQEGSLNVPPPPEDRRLFLFGNQNLNPELIAETKQRMLLILLGANAAILVTTGYLGYFLAGRTLKPIRAMIDEQNRFITDASHELKTPLTALRSELEVALMSESKLQLSESKQLIKSGLEEIVSLQHLAENLLELTQQQKKIGGLKTGKVSLLEVVEGAFKKVIPLAKRKRITIQNNVEDFLLNGESQSLTELFVVFLDNAIKYSKKGSEIVLTTEKTDHSVDVSIMDNGIGIAEKDLPHIFDRFYRADKSRSKTLGYGLGLSIANQIVKAHKGSISVHKNNGRGTTFIARLPLYKK